MNAAAVILLLLSMVACMLAMAFFAGVESGMLNVSRARLMSLVRSGSPRAKRLARSVADMPRVITTVLVGTNIFGVLASTLSAAACVRMFPSSGWGAAVWSFAVALAVLFGCEYLPKLLFTSRPLRRLLLVAGAYGFAEDALRPVVSVFQRVVRAVFGTPASSRPHRLTMSRDGLRTLVADKVNGARLTDFERTLIERVLALQTVFAEELMTPIGRAAKVRERTSFAKCIELARRTGHVHLPVFADDGSVSGVLDVFALLRASPAGVAPDGIARDAARPTLLVPPRTRADDILPMMRRSRSAMAVVADPSNGRVLGIITEENVMMALLGGRAGSGEEEAEK